MKKTIVLVSMICLINILLLINLSSSMLSQQCSNSSYLFESSDIIVNGTIKSVETDQIEGQICTTTLTINAENYGKGSVIGDVKIKLPGCKVGTNRVEVEDTPLFTAEDIGIRGQFFLINSTYINRSENEFMLTCGHWTKIETDISGCKNYYWFDNDNKNCSQKQFCGMYMYWGLRTFESRTQCLNHVNETEPCPQLGQDTDFCKYGEVVPQEKDENGCARTPKCYKNLSNGRKAEIKIMPETASATAIARLGELGFNITLKEVGKGNETKPIYELTGKKQGKFLGIFKIMVRVKAQVDAETGDVKIIKPWWSFLASGV